MTVRELQYADDNATPAHSPEDLQQAADLYGAACRRFGLQVNVSKTKVLAQSSAGQSLPQIKVNINECNIELVEDFPYLGSILSHTGSFEKDIDNRINAAHSTYRRLTIRVLSNHDLTLTTKIMEFRVIVFSVLL